MKKNPFLNPLRFLTLIFLIQGVSLAKDQWVLDTVISTGTYSYGIAITPDGSKLVVTNSTTPGTIKIVSTSDYAMTTVNYPTDGYPNGVAITADGSTAIVNTTHQTVAVDISSNSLLGYYAAPCVGTTLYGIAVYGSSVVYPDLDSNCVKSGIRSINAVPPNSSSAFTPITTSGVLLGIAVSGNDAIVTATNAPPLHVNLATSGVQTITGMTQSYGLAMLHTKNEALVFDGDSVDLVSLAVNSVTKHIASLSFNSNFQNIAVTADDKFAFVIGAFEKLIISLANDSVVQNISGGGINVAAASDGSKFFVTDSYNGVVRVYKYVANAGINDFKNGFSGFFVSPDPASGKFTVSSQAKMKSVEVLNTLGNILFESGNLNLNRVTIDLSARPKGIYFLRIAAGERIRSEKIVLP